MTAYDIADLRQLVDNLLKQYPGPADDFREHLPDIELAIYDKALGSMNFIGEWPNDSNEDILYQAFLISQTYWDYIIAYILEKTGKSIPRCAFFATFYPIGRMDDIIQDAGLEEFPAYMAKIIKAAMDRAIEHVGSSLFNLVPDHMPQMVSPTEAELESVQHEFNQDTVTEIMALMSELGGTFYTDPKKYDNPAMVEKHRRLVTIIQALAKSQPAEN